jgi:NAD(P)-dependent dehydrogenase (short-subunit alcohol dehydrogenase family)
MNPFHEQVAVITGAGSGIGKAIALALGKLGARLALVGRRTEPLKAVAESARPAEARLYSADLACEGKVRELAAELVKDFRSIDVLVHNAAVHRMGSAATGSTDDFHLQYRLNLFSPYLLTQLLLPLIADCRGQIVFINSSVGLTARAGIGPFSATKHGLKAIADSLRDEVNRDGIRVLSVFPGRTATPNLERVHAEEGRPYHPERMLQPEDVASVVINALCLPRTAEVTEIKIRPMLKFD